ncbi:hypothetical protein F4802DRAFT_599177 [Xylaria palmicola]|nr:hypothetical protein F4802DRAFT_599177 [Xylaria palmicola]
MSDSSDDGYGGEYDGLNEDLGSNDVPEFPLVEHLNAPAVAARGEIGSLKHHLVKEDVERAVLRESTLVVLKIQMHAVPGDQKFKRWKTPNGEARTISGCKHGRPI